MRKSFVSGGLRAFGVPGYPTRTGCPGCGQGAGYPCRTRLDPVPGLLGEARLLSPVGTCRERS